MQDSTYATSDGDSITQDESTPKWLNVEALEVERDEVAELVDDGLQVLEEFEAWCRKVFRLQVRYCAAEASLPDSEELFEVARRATGMDRLNDLLDNFVASTEASRLECSTSGATARWLKEEAAAVDPALLPGWCSSYARPGAAS